MKTNCNVIRDLLPLYIDKISSEETNKLIEEHFEECEECKKYYEIMKDETKVSDIDEEKVLKKFSKKMKKKRLKAIILAIIVTLILGLVIWRIFTKDDFMMKYEEGIVTIEEQEDGAIFANVNTSNYSMCQTIFEENYDGSVDVFITLYQTIADKFYVNEESKPFGCIQKCYKDYINENIDINWIWENNKGKMTVMPHNDVQITNIYYIDNPKVFDIIAHSSETTDPAFEMQKIWSNEQNSINE